MKVIPEKAVHWIHLLPFGVCVCVRECWTRAYIGKCLYELVWGAHLLNEAQVLTSCVQLFLPIFSRLLSLATVSSLYRNCGTFYFNVQWSRTFWCFIAVSPLYFCRWFLVYTLAVLAINSSSEANGLRCRNNRACETRCVLHSRTGFNEASRQINSPRISMNQIIWGSQGMVSTRS